MSLADIVRAWKDESYRAGLSDAERAALPANPAGAIELTEAELDNDSGGRVGYIQGHNTSNFTCPVHYAWGYAGVVTSGVSCRPWCSHQ
jgi:mersacidin/lichenicidin family type 2 lantibiotic